MEIGIVLVSLTHTTDLFMKTCSKLNRDKQSNIFKHQGSSLFREFFFFPKKKFEHKMMICVYISEILYMHSFFSLFLAIQLEGF